MYILNIARAIEKMSDNEITVIIQWNAWKKRFAIAREQINKKIRDSRNTKEHYQSFIRMKNIKSETITYQPKTFEKPNIVDEKSVITEYPKRLHKLANNLSHAEKVGFNSSLNSDTQKSKNFSNKKYVKVTKWRHAFKGYASTYNVEILN